MRNLFTCIVYSYFVYMPICMFSLKLSCIKIMFYENIKWSLLYGINDVMKFNKPNPPPPY